jgi:phosphoenolpyruvate carboxykinase (ATP)
MAAPTRPPRQGPRLHRMAWHSLFIRNLLIRPRPLEEIRTADPCRSLTIVDLPSFKADPKRHGCRSETVVAIDFTRKIVLIGGSYYAGEMKKSVFTYLNYYLPAKGVCRCTARPMSAPKDDSRDLLRPVGHRQDHALGRSRAHADRR